MAFSGELVSIKPSSIRTGLPINLVVTFKVTTDSWWEAFDGWYASLFITLDGMEGSFEPDAPIRGYEKTFSQQLLLGPDVMPGYALRGYVTIKCFASMFPWDTGEVVYHEPITISVEGIPNGDEDGVPPEEEKKFPLIPIAAGVGGLLIVVFAATGKRGHLTKRK